MRHKPLPENLRIKALNLLANTDVPMNMIAKRMDCSPSTIKTLNNEYRIRTSGHKPYQPETRKM